MRIINHAYSTADFDVTLSDISLDEHASIKDMLKRITEGKHFEYEVQLDDRHEIHRYYLSVPRLLRFFASPKSIIYAAQLASKESFDAHMYCKGMPEQKLVAIWLKDRAAHIEAHAEHYIESVLAK
jgi:hypothetical protein